MHQFYHSCWDASTWLHVVVVIYLLFVVVKYHRICHSLFRVDKYLRIFFFQILKFFKSIHVFVFAAIVVVIFFWRHRKLASHGIFLAVLLCCCNTYFCHGKCEGKCLNLCIVIANICMYVCVCVSRCLCVCAYKMAFKRKTLI